MDNEQLVARIKSEGQSSEDMLNLWEKNKAFVAMIARRYSSIAEMEDLQQEGFIGLYEAARHYEADKGILFINYAAFWIKQRMRRYVDNCCRMVRLPSHAVDEAQRYKKIAGEYCKYYGHEATDSEMSTLLGVSEEKLDQIKKVAHMRQIRSLDEPMPGMDEDVTIGDTISSDVEIEENVIEAMDTEEMKRELWLAVDGLPNNQPAVIRLRYQEGKTLKETGERFGISLQNVKKIQDKAVRTLKQRSHRYKYRRYYEEYLSSASVRHIGVQRFNETWTSEVEREALRWAEKELGCL